jgi:hypothetical protein
MTSVKRNKDVCLHGSFGERASRFGRCAVACPSPIQRSRSHSGHRPTPTGPFLAFEAMQGLKNRADGTGPSRLAEVNPNRIIEFYPFHDGNNNDRSSMFRAADDYFGLDIATVSGFAWYEPGSSPSSIKTGLIKAAGDNAEEKQPRLVASS